MGQKDTTNQKWVYNFLNSAAKSKSILETPEKVWNMFKVNNKDIRTHYY